MDLDLLELHLAYRIDLGNALPTRVALGQAISSLLSRFIWKKKKKILIPSLPGGKDLS